MKSLDILQTRKEYQLKNYYTKLVYYDICKKHIRVHRKMDTDSVLIVSGLKENVLHISSKTLNAKIASLTKRELLIKLTTHCKSVILQICFEIGNSLLKRMTI